MPNFRKLSEVITLSRILLSGRAENERKAGPQGSVCESRHFMLGNARNDPLFRMIF
jgi:hypothetical protein